MSVEWNIGMITRSRLKAKREEARTAEKRRRTERKRKLIERESSTSSYQLRSAMRRKGGISNQAASRRLRRVDSAEVTPVRLFSLIDEEDSDGDKLYKVGEFVYGHHVPMHSYTIMS